MNERRGPGLFVILLLPAMICVLQACHLILEDRVSCPCFLHLDLSDASCRRFDSLFVAVSAEGFFLENIAGPENISKGITLKIPVHSGVYVNVCDVESSECCCRDGLVIPEGCQCPRLYSHSSFCRTDGGEAEDTVVLYKNHCVVDMTFRSEYSSRYLVTVLGDVCGYAVDGQPRDGDFSYDVLLSSDGRGTFCLPRQKDASLVLAIKEWENGGEGSEKYFYLGNYILQSGYDWSEENLQDISIVIDYDRTHFSLDINGWKTEEKFDILI